MSNKYVMLPSLFFLAFGRRLRFGNTLPFCTFNNRRLFSLRFCFLDFEVWGMVKFSAAAPAL